MTDDSSRRPFLVESLVHQCYHYIAMNLEKFPVSYLSLLPLKSRKELLWRLPIADLCQLEDTEYMKGFQDMAAYWKLPCEEFQGIAAGDIDIIQYVEEWDEAEYAKAILYGQVATTIIGCIYDEFVFSLPFHDELDPHDNGVVISFLYAVRKPLVRDASGYKLMFPSRYHTKRNITLKKDIINAVISCFKRELPKVLAEIYLYEDVNNKYYELLTNVTYLGVHGGVFEQPISNFVEQIIQRSTCLEVIILESYFDEAEELTSVSGFATFLSTQVSFLSRFRLLKILTNMSYCKKT